MNKCRLLRRDPFVNKGLKAVSEYLRDNFVSTLHKDIGWRSFIYFGLSPLGGRTIFVALSSGGNELESSQKKAEE